MTMPHDSVPLTRAAYEEMQRELEHLRTERRREVAEEIRTARESELDQDSDVVPALEAAKEVQEGVEGRINLLEQTLGRATIIDEEAARASDTVQIGSVVVLEDERGGERVYQILSTMESDPTEGKISQDSPIGSAVLGKRAGDTVDVDAPAGVQRLRIKELR